MISKMAWRIKENKLFILLSNYFWCGDEKKKTMNFVLNRWGSGACLSTSIEISVCNEEDESAAWK